MPDVRKKLVELLEKFVPTVWAEDCEGNRHPKCDDILCAECIADRLIANGVTIQRWIPANERKPQEFVSVLIYAPSDAPFPTVHEGYRARENWVIPGIAILSEHEVTHWTQMPTGPEGGD